VHDARPVTATAGSRTGSWWVTAALFTVALLLYALLRQNSLHGFDVYYLLQWLEGGGSHAQHPAWLPLARGMHALLRPFGATPFDSLCLLSALGMATGVAALHRAALVRGTPREALWVALLAGTLPAIVHFATVLEMHGALFGVASLAWWQCARLGRDPGIGKAVWLGVLGGAATLVHASGIVLPMLWGLMLPSLGISRWRQVFLLVTVAGLVQLAVIFAGRFGLRAIWPPVLEGDVDTFLRDVYAASKPLPVVLHVLWWEWLWAYAAASFAAPLLLFPRFTRREAVLLHVGVLALIAPCAVLLYSGNVEHGAYLVPLAFPLCGLLAGTLRTNLLAMVLLGNVGATTWHFTHPDRPPADAAFGEAVAALERERKVSLLVADWEEYDGVMRYQSPAFADFAASDGALPRIDSARLQVDKLKAQLHALPDETLLRAWLLQQATDEARHGRSFLITDGAVTYLERELPAFAKAWQEPLPGVERVRCERGPLRGTELRAR
jgi:hypothetical protein